MRVFNGNGPPDSSVIGYVGDIYVDISSGITYKCVDILDDGSDLGFVTVYSYDSVKSKCVWVSPLDVILDDIIAIQESYLVTP